MAALMQGEVVGLTLGSKPACGQGRPRSCCVHKGARLLPSLGPLPPHMPLPQLKGLEKAYGPG